MEQLEDLEKRESKLLDDRHQGERAKAILEDEIFRGAFDSLRERCWAQFRSIPEDDTDGMTKIRYTLSVIDSVEKDVTHHMNTGKLSNADLGLLAQLREQANRLFAVGE